MPEARIRPRDRDAILQSLGAGVVPRRGQQHIQVGRAPEVAALLRDIERIADGGSAVRFVIGEYGAGKSFFLQLIRSIALEKNLITMHADLSPDRRLHATGGAGPDALRRACAQPFDTHEPRGRWTDVGGRAVRQLGAPAGAQ